MYLILCGGWGCVRVHVLRVSEEEGAKRLKWKKGQRYMKERASAVLQTSERWGQESEGESKLTVDSSLKSQGANRETHKMSSLFHGDNNSVRKPNKYTSFFFFAMFSVWL